MTCQKCGMGINVDGYPSTTPWVEVHYREGYWLGDKAEIVVTKYEVFCLKCYEKLQRGGE